MPASRSQAGHCRASPTAIGRVCSVVEHRKDHLVAPAGPPIRRTGELKPIKIVKTPAGDTVVDMGQNMVGWVRLRTEGPAGTTITLRHAEVLDKQGNFYIENLRAAKQTVRYTLNGRGAETFEPHFTFQGFRYVAVDGYPGPLTLDSLTGVVVHSDMAPASTFESSKPLVNQLQHNIVWGQKGNFVDVPTDCPQRDERLGWMGDAQVFAPTAAFNMDVAGFFTKWLRDVAADQVETGSVPHVIPDILSAPGKPQAGSAAWADAAVIIPVDDVPQLRGPAHPRDAVPQHGGVGRVHAAPRRRRLHLERGFHLRRLARVREHGLRLSRGHDGKGPYRHRDVRPFD